LRCGHQARAFAVPAENHGKHHSRDWVAAAAPTSLSYVPQVKKALPSGATQDLSLNMLVALATGLALWVLYGSFKGDSVIILVNIVGFGMRSNSTT
jgi:MtN3 and saliva related transmembrane protein